jgi:hypothetical protein
MVMNSSIIWDVTQGLASNGLHGVICQKIVLFSVYLTYQYLLIELTNSGNVSTRRWAPFNHLYKYKTYEKILRGVTCIALDFLCRVWLVTFPAPKHTTKNARHVRFRTIILRRMK